MKLLDTANIKDIQSLITNGNTLNVRVNFYQRPYKWTTKKVIDLFEDYKENEITAISEGNSSEYFIGAVVLVDERKSQNNNDEHAWKYQIVDGQQRFTTLFLFNYIKYMLLIRKVDVAAQKNISTDFIEGLKSIENCYKGYIGEKNVQAIQEANKGLSLAFDTANRNRCEIDNAELNFWRKKVGWIENPDISEAMYFDKCRIAMEAFLADEKMNIFYENDNFNKSFKEALSKVVFKFADVSDASFCEEPIEEYIAEYDEEDVRQIDFPYIMRAYDIFNQTKKYYNEQPHQGADPYEKLSGYIKLIDEMLKNIKLCLIVTSNEDDAYKLFETLNDRSESVNDLELLKNYFFKAYTEGSTEPQIQINANIMNLDNKWRDIFFSYEELEPEIFEYMTVFFTGKTGKYTNERKRKLLKEYFASNKINGINYTYDKILRDFNYMDYIYEILLSIHRVDKTNHRRVKDEDAQLSLYIENDSCSSIVKRALGIAMNVQYSVVCASLICDIIHNYEVNVKSTSTKFRDYLGDIFDENRCKTLYLGLWKDACLLWKAIILSKNFKTPKIFSDKLADLCNIKMINTTRPINDQLISFTTEDENTLFGEFEDWINDWKFADGIGKIKIKNLFMHMFLKYDYDKSSDQLVLETSIVRKYLDKAIKQDLDHMDANLVDRKNGNEIKYFHYNLSDRKDYTNSLGNMLPLPVEINRGKHNKPMEETIKAFSSEKLNGWIFEMVKEEFNNYSVMINGYRIPTVDFFIKRKARLIDFFKRIVANQKFSPQNKV